MKNFLARSSARRPVAITLTLAAAAAGGALFALIGLPAAWMSGALVAITAIALAGFPAQVPDGLRRVVFLILGISMGSAVTPETIAGLGTWPISLVFLALSIPVTMAAVMYYLRLTGWDGESTLYASAPGALTSVLALAAAAGVDVRKVAFAQSIRAFLLVVALPGALVSLDLAAPEGKPLILPMFPTGNLWELALMVAAGVAGGLLADRLGVPGGLIVGSMIANAILHGTGWIEARVPQIILIPCFTALGAFIGARFVGTDLTLVRRLIADSLGAFVVAVAVALSFAVIVTLVTGEVIGKTILAFAPGGLEAMIILAFLIGLDPAYVSAHHVLRFVLIALCLPFVSRFLFGRPPANGGD